MTYKKKDGFTLIELVVVTAVLGMVIIAATGVFITAISGINRAYAKQNALDSLRFINESMAKELRMSVVGAADGGPQSSISIQNQEGQYVSYAFSGGNLTRNGIALNAGGVNVSFGAFYVRNAGGKTRVTILMRARNNAQKAIEQAEISAQTTISTR